jgi:arsenate reductase (glutaredoxin)
MPITIYHNPNCSTSRKVLGWLRDKGHQLHVIEYLKTPPSIADLKKLLKAMDATAQDIVRRKGDAYEALGNIAAMDAESLLARMVAEPVLIERPIVINGSRAVLCRPAERVWEVVD